MHGAAGVTAVTSVWRELVQGAWLRPLMQKVPQAGMRVEGDDCARPASFQRPKFVIVLWTSAFVSAGMLMSATWAVFP